MDDVPAGGSGSSSGQQNPPPASDDAAATNLEKIKLLLRAKDDTQRFVGLALLKTALDNSVSLREDEGAIRGLWRSTSAKFLDRLLRTGLNPSNKDGKDMLDLAVAVLHTFALLLPGDELCESKFTDRVPTLVSAVLHSSPGTTELLLQLLLAIVSTQQGAEALTNLDDISPLTETAPSNPSTLDVIARAWLSYMVHASNKAQVGKRIGEIIQSLVSSFKGTDAVTLLDFLGTLLRQLDSTATPPQHKWLETVVGYVQNLVISRPNADARAAYTNAAASLLQVYPNEAGNLLFVDRANTEKPFGYLFVNLLLIDIRSSAPALLEQLNDPDYPKVSRRLASAFDIVCIFIGFLVKSLEDESMETLVMPPDSLLKLRKGISETMSVSIEYLRDRWDASVAGAMGLHPEARVGTAETAKGSHYTLAWDSMKNNADEDPFILSAIRALALWLREDENDSLRKEATGLTDMFLDLYRSSSSGGQIDFRSPVLVALEALTTLEKGRRILLDNGGWKVLTQELSETLQGTSYASHDDVASRGVEIVRVLLPIAEEERTGTAEDWMNLITTVAAWDVPEHVQTPVVLEFEVAVLQLCTTLLTRATPGMRARYVHSLSAVAGIASHVEKRIGAEDPLRELIDDVLESIASLRKG